MIKPLTIIMIPGDKLRDIKFDLVPKERPALVIGVGDDTLPNVRPFPGVQFLLGTTNLEQAKRDGIIIDPNEIKSFGFKFKETLFRKEVVHAISFDFARKLQILGEITPERKDIISDAISKYL